MKKVLIIGHARHGKDTVAEMLKDAFGYTFKSSSQAAAEIFIYEALAEKHGYTTPEQCFEDRVNRRQEWHDLICDYNKKDPARLAKAIMKEADIYVGMRSNKEIEACVAKGIFDIIIGVYDPRKKKEPKSSFDIDLWAKSDIVISNAGTLIDLRRKVEGLKPLLVQPKPIKQHNFKPAFEFGDFVYVTTDPYQLKHQVISYALFPGGRVLYECEHNDKACKYYHFQLTTERGQVDPSVQEEF